MAKRIKDENGRVYVEKKPFYKKWWFILLVVLLIVSPFLGKNAQNSTTNSSTAQKTTTTSNSQSEQTESNEETVTVDKPVFNIGDSVTVGDVVYIVHGIESAKTVGTEYFNETADGPFMIINMTITNNGKEALSVSDGFFKVLNNDVEYSPDSAASIHINEDSQGFWLESINPGLSKSGKVAFDVTDAVIAGPGSQLKVQTGIWGTQTEVINLN
ncbi:DUF4352 domain-containing protein [Streptococcus rifensis]